jgi:hypothetical protein
VTKPPSTEALLALALLAGAPTWADAATVLESHRELDDLDDEYLVAVGTAIRENGSEELGVSMIEAAFFLRITREEGVARAVEGFKARGTEKHPPPSAELESVRVTALMQLREEAVRLTREIFDGPASPEAARAAADAWRRLLEHPAFPGLPNGLVLGAYGEAAPILLLAWTAAPDAAYLDLLERCHRVCADHEPARSTERGDELTQLARVLVLRYGQTSNRSDLDAALAAYDEALELLPAVGSRSDRFGFAEWDRRDVLHEAGNASRERYLRSGAVDDLDAAEAFHREAVASTAAGAANLPLYLNDLGNDLRLLYQRTNDGADLEAAISAHEHAIQLAPAGNPSRPAFLSNLGNELRDRYLRTSDPSELDRAVELHRDAVADAGPDVISDFLNNLGNDLRVRYQRTGDDRDREESLVMFRAALEHIGAGDPSRPMALMDVAVGLIDAYRRTGSTAQLDEAIAMFREAVTSTPEGSPQLSKRLLNLGLALDTRYEEHGDEAALDEAAATIDKSMRVAVGEVDRDALLANVGVSLSTRYRRDARLQDVEAGIRALDEARSLTPTTSPERPWIDETQGSLLRLRFGRVGRLDDLGRAAALVRDAVAATPPGAPDASARLNLLGLILLDRHRATGAAEDLQEAVRSLEAALASAGPHSWNRAAMLTTLAALLMTRFRDAGPDPDDAARAQSLLREALDATPAAAPSRSLRLNGLGTSILVSSGGDPHALDEAVDLLRQSVEEGGRQINSLALLLRNLAEGYRARHAARGRDADRADATATLRRCCILALDTAVETALATARTWGDWAGNLRAWPEAAEAYAIGVEAAERMFRIQLLRSEKETQLRESGDTAARAAYAASAAGDPRAAVLALERGRALLLTDSLELARADLAQLEQHEGGARARRYHEAVDRWSRLSASTLDRDGLVSVAV